MTPPTLKIGHESRFVVDVRSRSPLPRERDRVRGFRLEKQRFSATRERRLQSHSAPHRGIDKADL